MMKKLQKTIRRKMKFFSGDIGFNWFGFIIVPRFELFNF